MVSLFVVVDRGSGRFFGITGLIIVLLKSGDTHRLPLQLRQVKEGCVSVVNFSARVDQFIIRRSFFLEEFSSARAAIVSCQVFCRGGAVVYWSRRIGMVLYVF